VKTTSPEFDRFANLTRRVLSVPHAEIKRKLDAENASKAKKKKRAKTSPAARASDGQSR
jgi:hypothetical protein